MTHYASCTILGFVPCPACKRDCGILKTPRGKRPYYQRHIFLGRFCRMSCRDASPVDVLALLGGKTESGG